MSVRTIKVAFGLAAVLVIWNSAASAQSGRSVMRGYVAFEEVAYVDKQPHAKIELCSAAAGKDCGPATQTDEHGLYEINPAPLGEKWLRITAPGFTTYEIRIYLPSDFIGNLAVMLKRVDNKKSNHGRTERGASRARARGTK